MPAHEPPDAAAEREAADAGVRDLSCGHRQAMLLRRSVDLAQQSASADAHDSALGVDVDCVERPQIDAESSVADRASRDRVPARADRESDPGSPGSTDGGGDVIGVGRVGDGRGVAVDRSVPACAGVVVVGVGRLDESADVACCAQC